MNSQGGALASSQQLRLFNAHYDEYGFQPIVVFDGDGGIVAAVLRSACRYWHIRCRWAVHMG
jgi:hypothetical protein